MTPIRILHLRSSSPAEDDSLAAAVERLGGMLDSVETPEAVAERLAGPELPQVVVIDQQVCDGACRGLVLSVRALAPELVLAVRLAAPEEEGAWWLCEHGADDVISRAGRDAERLARWLARLTERKAATLPTRACGDRRGPVPLDRRGPGTAPLALLTAAVAASRRPVLVMGEAGTGKSRLARCLHEAGDPRAPFVAFHADGLPEAAVEVLLFRGEGRGRGAGGLGALERARGGTLVIEEVAALPRGVQAELLRRLEGESAPCRLVATTSIALEPLVRARQFSPELLALIAAVRIELPPLRERRRELPALIGQLLAEYRVCSVPPVEGVAPDALRALLEHTWPGNLRELEEVIRHAVGLARDTIVTRETLPEGIARLGGGSAVGITTCRAAPARGAFKPQLESHLARAERAYLERLLARHQGRLGECAERSGIARRRLSQRLRRHGIDPAGYRPGVAMASDRQLLLGFAETAGAEG